MHQTHFKPYSKHTKKQFTKSCYACRQKETRWKAQANCKVNICRKQWLDWKEKNKCQHCGIEDPDVLQADHIGKKEKELSNYTYWSKQGPEKQMLEFQNTRCLCRFCHNVSTRKQFFKQKVNRLNTKKSRREDRVKALKMEFVLREKLRRGSCATCHKEVTSMTSNCFIFDHGANHRDKRISISKYIHTNKCGFPKAKRVLEREMNLCRLLCSNCDWKATRNDLWGHKQQKPWEEEKIKFYNF